MEEIVNAVETAAEQVKGSEDFEVTALKGRSSFPIFYFELSFLIDPKPCPLEPSYPNILGLRSYFLEPITGTVINYYVGDLVEDS